MVIHTKKKAKIHMHEPKKAKIKGSNIYTVQRGPKIASAKINDTGKKKSYRKSTIHQAEKKEKEPSKFKRNIRESNTSIKTKNTNLHIAGRTGALAAGAVTEQVEGGQEVSQAAYLAYEVSRPVTGTASRGASLFRKKAAAEAKRRIKKVGKELRINMTTNATLLNEKIVDFLQKHNFDLMISLDGPESVQNKSRVFADNSHGTFDVIIQKIEMIQKLYPQYLDKISFNAVIDEQNDFACSSNFFTYDFLKDAVVTAAGVSDRDSVQEVSLRETFYINYNYELFKSFIVYAGELDNKYISKLIVSHKGLLISSIHDRVTKPYRRKGICHPNGPCIAGYNRLFVTVEGKFYPCERVSETNEVYCIGDIKSGIETKKVLRLLNTGKLTETECKNCWALNLCSICAADFGEDNDLSTSKKLQKCSVAKKEVEEHLVEYCTLREYGFNFEN